MVNSDLYAKDTSNQQTEASHILGRTVPLMHFNEKETILDVGCGSGHVTARVLKSYLPTDCSIVGADMSENMIKFARINFEQPNMTFRIIDINSSNIWDSWKKSSFEKIFSFFCLHWVDNTMQAVENLASLLKDNGDLVTLIAIDLPYSKIFKVLHCDPKYSHVKKEMKTLEGMFRDFNYNQYIVELKSHGFEIISTELLEKKRRYNDMKEWNDFFDSINPFLDHVNKEDRKELSERAAQYLFDQGLVKLTEDGGVEYNYKIFNTHARKLGSGSN